FNYYVGRGVAQRNAVRSTAEIRDRLPVEPVGRRPGKIDLVVILLHLLLVDKNELGDDRSPLELAILAQIWDVANNQVVAVKCDSVPLFNEEPEVVVMIDQ